MSDRKKSAVRDIAGYCRYSGERGTAALQAVCNACGLLPSLFYPCMKLVSKERAGPEYRKRRDAAKPPYQRLIEWETAGQEPADSHIGNHAVPTEPAKPISN
jgi:hypothetical protein